jgi:glycosyltransferase involved in cell wall biosynthesis
LWVIEKNARSESEIAVIHNDPSRVSIVIPTYMRRDRLSAVIQPLLNDTETCEVVVVIDGGDDGSYELVDEWAGRDRRLRPIMTEHKGQAAAQQSGVDAARGDVVLLIDDDVVPEPGLVSGHAAHHRADADLVVVGHMPVVLPAVPAARDWVARGYATRYDRTVKRWQQDSDRILLGLWGGNVSIRRSHLERIPIQLPGTHVRYHIDLEFGMRCWKAGLRAVFDPMLTTRHEYARTVQQFLRDRAASAADRAIIHRLHEDVIGPLPEDYFRADRRLPMRLLLRATRRGSVPFEVLLERVVRLEGVARLYGAEAWTADLLARMRSQRIVREVDDASRTSVAR